MYRAYRQEDMRIPFVLKGQVGNRALKKRNKKIEGLGLVTGNSSLKFQRTPCSWLNKQ
jgi:hypothetical protein